MKTLQELGACRQGLAFAPQFPTLQAAWAACERPDWMLWYLGAVGTDRKVLVLCACDCARLALPIYETRYPDDPRPRKAIETAEAWARGEATLERVRAHADADIAAYAALVSE